MNFNKAQLLVNASRYLRMHMQRFVITRVLFLLARQ